MRNLCCPKRRNVPSLICETVAAEAVAAMARTASEKRMLSVVCIRDVCGCCVLFYCLLTSFAIAGKTGDADSECGWYRGRAG